MLDDEEESKHHNKELREIVQQWKKCHLSYLE